MKKDAQQESAEQLARDLNSNNPNAFNLKLCTVLIQEPNPVKFSELCEQQLKTINPETLVNYNICPLITRTNYGDAIIFTATLQFWLNDSDHKEWINTINNKSRILKP